MHALHTIQCQLRAYCQRPRGGRAVTAAAVATEAERVCNPFGISVFHVKMSLYNSPCFIIAFIIFIDGKLLTKISVLGITKFWKRIQISSTFLALKI